MAEGLYAGINGQAAPLTRPALGWEAERLMFVVLPGILVFKQEGEMFDKMVDDIVLNG